MSVETVVADEMSISRPNVTSGGFRSTVKVYDGKNVYCDDAAESVLSTNPKLEAKYGTVSVFGEMMPFFNTSVIHGTDTIVLKANRRAQKRTESHTRASAHNSNVVKCIAKSKKINSIRLSHNFRSVLYYVAEKYFIHDGVEKSYYEYCRNYDNVTVYLTNRSVIVTISKIYEFGLTFLGKNYKNQYSLTVGIVHHLMKESVLHYAGSDVEGRSGLGVAYYLTKKYFRLSKYEQSIIFDGKLSATVRNESIGIAARQYGNTSYLDSVRPYYSVKGYSIASDEGEHLYKLETTLLSKELSRNGISIAALKNNTFQSYDENLLKRVKMRTGIVVGKMPKTKGKIVVSGAKIKSIEDKLIRQDNGISYLYTEMRRLNSKIDNVARETRERLERNQRQMNERLERLEHNQRTILNNKN
jgi:hypothetical protein